MAVINHAEDAQDGFTEHAALAHSDAVCRRDRGLRLGFPRLEQEYLAAYSHGMSIASAQATLSAIASGMLALTGIVFALAFVMVQFNAVAYSPRLVAWFGRDPVLFHSLGLFTATFGYAIAAMSWTDRGGNGRVPLFSTLLVVVLLALWRVISMAEKSSSSVVVAIERCGPTHDGCFPVVFL